MLDTELTSRTLERNNLLVNSSESGSPENEGLAVHLQTEYKSLIQGSELPEEKTFEG